MTRTGWLAPLLFSGASLDPLGAVATLLLRLYVGGVVVLVHGGPKVLELFAGEGHFLPLVEGLGLPFPLLMAWMAALTQLGGGLFVMLGLLTRPAALGVASTIGIGVVSVHWQDGFHAMEAGFAYVVVMLVLAVAGAGPLSVDRKLLGPDRG